MKNIVITIVLVLCSFLFVVFLTNAITIYAQQQMPRPSSNTPPKIPSQSPSSTSPKAVKIISPIKGQQIPVGKDLTISGTSIDNANSNCQVSMSVNRIRPYQPTTAAGTGGANDYSKWNFVLTPNYTTIKPGPDNRITAKYTCTDNSVVASPTYSSVNVTGVMDSTSTTVPTTNVLLQQQKQQTMTTSNNATTISNGNPNKITPQGKPSLTMSNNNTNAIVNSVSTPATHTASTPTNTPDSGKLLYLGINSKSANKADDTNTKAVAHHSNSDDDVGSKIKVNKVSDSASSSSDDDVGSKIKVNKVRDSASSSSDDDVGSKIKVNKVRDSASSSASSDDDVGSKIKVNKVSDSNSGSSSASSTSTSSDDDVGSKIKVNKVRDSASSSASSDDDVGSKIKVNKVSDSNSGSSSASSTSTSSDDDVGSKIKVHKLHPVAHSQSSTNTDHTNIDPVPPLISDNTLIHPHPFFQHTHSSNKVNKVRDSNSGSSSASISDHVTSKIKVHDSKDDNNYSNELADNIIKDVENSLKGSGINIDLG
jgi:hypothetical protein